MADVARTGSTYTDEPGAGVQSNDISIGTVPNDADLLIVFQFGWDEADDYDFDQLNLDGDADTAGFTRIDGYNQCNTDNRMSANAWRADVQSERGNALDLYWGMNSDSGPDRNIIVAFYLTNVDTVSPIGESENDSGSTGNYTPTLSGIGVEDLALLGHCSYNNAFDVTGGAGQVEIYENNNSETYGGVSEEVGQVSQYTTGTSSDWGGVAFSVSAAASGYSITIEAGSYAITGTAVGVLKNSLVTAEAGSYAITGTAVGVLKNSLVTAEAGSYAITGTAAGLLLNRVISAEAGSLAITGADVTLTYNADTDTLTAESGSFTVTGSDVGLIYNRALTIEPGTITLTGQAAALLFNRLITAGAGSITVTGTAAGLLYSRLISAEAGAIALTGAAVTLDYSGEIIPSGEASVTFTVSQPGASISVSTPAASFTLTQPAINISKN